jgi:hypothetical protein
MQQQQQLLLQAMPQATTAAQQQGAQQQAQRVLPQQPVGYAARPPGLPAQPQASPGPASQQGGPQAYAYTLAAAPSGGGVYAAASGPYQPLPSAGAPSRPAGAPMVLQQQQQQGQQQGGLLQGSGPRPAFATHPSPVPGQPLGTQPGAVPGTPPGPRPPAAGPQMLFGAPTATMAQHLMPMAALVMPPKAWPGAPQQ